MAVKTGISNVGTQSSTPIRWRSTRNVAPAEAARLTRRRAPMGRPCSPEGHLRDHFGVAKAV